MAKTPIARPRVMSFPATPWSQQGSWEIKEKETVSIAPLPAPELLVLRVMGQIANTYIVAEGPDGLYLIDQHTAHERILYERILAQWLEREVEVQGLLQPITVELSPGEEQTLEANKGILTQLGFTIEPFGGRNYLIRTVPALVASTDVVEVVSMLLGNLASKDSPTPWEEKIAESLACHSAIRGEQQLGNEEMRELIRQLEQARQPRTCPMAGQP